MANGVQTFEIDFNVDYRTVGRTDSLFKWKNGPFVRTGSLFRVGLAFGRSTAFGHGFG
jgi:hypothetical protein